MRGQPCAGSRSPPVLGGCVWPENGEPMFRVTNHKAQALIIKPRHDQNASSQYAYPGDTVSFRIEEKECSSRPWSGQRNLERWRRRAQAPVLVTTGQSVATTTRPTSNLIPPQLISRSPNNQPRTRLGEAEPRGSSTQRHEAEFAA